MARPIAPLFLALLVGCTDAESSRVVSLDMATTDPTTLKVGQTLTFTVRAVMGDGTSVDVTDRSTCTLSEKDPPGTLALSTFTAVKPGTTNIVCLFAGVRDELALTVAGGLETTISKIQRGDHQQGTQVKVKAVVVVVKRGGSNDEFVDFYGQEPGKSGAHTGIWLRDERPSESEDKEAPPALTLEVGDVVEVTGIYIEDAAKGRSQVEFSAITVTGKTETPRAAQVTIKELDIARWDGCFVQVSDVVVTNPAADDYAFEVESQGDRLLVDSEFHDLKPAAGQEFKTIQGVIYVGPRAKDGPPALALAPRSKSDAEAGQVDPKARTILDVQSGKVAENTVVKLSAVVVATDFDPQKGYYDFWAQDPGGGQGSGMVFRDYRDSAVALTLSEGDVVEVTGVYVENKGRSSINFSSAKTSGSQKTVKPDPLKPKEVVEAWEGCLVVVKGTFKVTDVAGTYTWEVQDEDGTRLLVDRLLFDPADTVKVGDSLTTLTGIVYAWIEGTTVNLSLAPRAAGDLKP